MTVLPAPTYDGNRRRWRVSAIINFEREQDGLPPLQFNPADERWLTSAQLRERFGGVSDCGFGGAPPAPPASRGSIVAPPRSQPTPRTKKPRRRADRCVRGFKVC
jgi:hypothetical protein